MGNDTEMLAAMATTMTPATTAATLTTTALRGLRNRLRLRLRDGCNSGNADGGRYGIGVGDDGTDNAFGPGIGYDTGDGFGLDNDDEEQVALPRQKWKGEMAQVFKKGWKP